MLISSTDSLDYEHYSIIKGVNKSEEVIKCSSSGEFSFLSLGANLLNEGCRVRRKEAGVAHIIIDNAIKHFFLIVAGERRLKERTEL